MTRSVPLTEARADAILQDILLMLEDVDDCGEISERLVSRLHGHKPAFLSLCGVFMGCSAEVIKKCRRRDIIAEFLPVVGPVVGFNAQLRELWMFEKIESGWLDDEIICDPNCLSRFALRKLPHVAFRSPRRAQLIRLVDRVNVEFPVRPKATVWDVLAILRSCRGCLPKKCAICLMRDCSWFNPRYDRFDRNAPRSYMMFFVDGARLAIRNVSENDYVQENTLFLDHVASTVDLLA